MAEWTIAIPPWRDKTVAYVYGLYLKSIKTGTYYIGSTKNIDKRLLNHNAGLSRWTKRGIPWILIYTESYKTRSEAITRELKIKSYKSGNEFRKVIQS